MSYLGLACAVALVGVFAVSARDKVGRERFRVFAASAGPLDVLPRQWRVRTARAVAVAELVIVAALAGGLVLALAGAGGLVLALGFLAAAALLTSFTVAIGLMVRRGERVPCHCFGASEVPLGVAHVVRNLLLLALAVVGPFTPAGGYAPVGVALAVVAGAVFATLVIRFDDLVMLFGSPSPATRTR
ncbi:MauE/DoxX family redox-associated membrane protein [Actinophytocola xanthii]|uniref:Methylamine utilisation protein MauE domain-containing protein n=1 Tax=Actinophytocola xanthii TaxID=1912961 RepID=A0A1Q8CY08_9PSEU|nr:MauE/DoxX family redox-associated membrane protein [Actinophytocola xanthii]OLF19240.1 hypothetical protein BU204_02500 [Actinophytocola xanthii]